MIVNGNLVAGRTYMTEVLLTSNSTNQSFNFLDIPTLRFPNVAMEAIQIFTATQNTISPNGNTVIAASALPGLTLTLSIGGQEERIKDYSCYDLVPSLNGGLIRVFNNLQVNLVKSYIKIVDTSIVTANTSVLVQFTFRNLNEEEQLIVQKMRN